MKRKAHDELPYNNVKLIKTEKDSSADYSKDVKKKISASARTGQACDRCRVSLHRVITRLEGDSTYHSLQVRKMRCDDQPSGCTPCMQNQSECKTTDRITGKATVRGYVQSLERQLEELQHRTLELEGRLAALGEDVRPSADCGDSTTAPLVQWHENQRASNKPSWEGNSQSLDASSRSAGRLDGDTTNGSKSNALDEHPPQLPDFRSGLAGNNYLGVSTGSSLLSSIRGTSMNVLGIEIDLADYMSADVDEPDPSITGAQPVYNKSYRAFVQTAFGTSLKLGKVELPPRSEGLNYAHVYFRVINPYLPIVHKPSLLATVSDDL